MAAGCRTAKEHLRKSAGLQAKQQQSAQQFPPLKDKIYTEEKKGEMHSTRFFQKYGQPRYSLVLSQITETGHSQLALKTCQKMRFVSRHQLQGEKRMQHV